MSKSVALIKCPILSRMLLLAQIRSRTFMVRLLGRTFFNYPDFFKVQI